ncbi:MAG: TOBE domain-containing protein [Desulfovibrio sp.]|nr:TOBE domain-containing protein [Desulfovibrio sp.]
MKTSARNVFHGIVSGISENGILSSVSLETSNKLVVTAIITNTSRKNLNLERGTPAVALVKAPWVSIAPSSGRAAISPGNSFQGEVETIRRDELACEIQVRLDQGGLICSLYANGACPEAEIETGSCVIASFSPFSVILIES